MGLSAPELWTEVGSWNSVMKSYRPARIVPKLVAVGNNNMATLSFDQHHDMGSRFRSSPWGCVVV